MNSSLHEVVGVLTAIVVVAGITTVVAHPTSAEIIKGLGSAFTSSVLAAQGIH